MNNIVEHTPMDALEVYGKITTNIEKVMKGQSVAIKKLLVAMVSGGHVLLEDFPGTGKTTLAKALALSIDSRFRRIQFTPDLLPSDILGISIYDQKDNQFRFHEGPVFTNILLADEINRASPRTQSALLEAMAENQVSIDGNVHRLEGLFFVIATQNPVEFHGTYPLPEAQMDRFSLQSSLGYVEPEEEVEIISSQKTRHPIEDIKSCVTVDDVMGLQVSAREVRISDEIKRYIVDIVRATRSLEGVALGASPRTSISLMKASQAIALFNGKEFVSPENIIEIAVDVIAHRVIMEPQARFSGITSKGIVEEILNSVPLPK